MSKPTKPNVRRTWCGLCHSRCGLLLELDGETPVGLRGDPDHPLSRGRLCARGRLMLEHLDHPERLNHPLKRVGPRGSGRFERVGWDEALDDMAARLAALRDEHGPETVAFSRGTYRSYHWEARRFLNLLGSPNLTGANPICHCPTAVVESALMGAMVNPDLRRAACVVIWGSARSVSSPVTGWGAIREARGRGARLIVVDPRRTREARDADLWLPLRPGSDAALMLGWLHVIFAEDLWDHEFVEGHTVGFEALRSQVEAYSPQRVAGLTWLPESLIVEAARAYATTWPAVITWGQGVDKLGPNTDAALMARVALRAVTGNLDVRGGELFGGGGRPARVIPGEALERNDALPAAQREKQLGGERHPLFSFRAWEAIGASQDRLPAGYVPRAETAKTVTAAPHAVYEAMRTGAPYPVRALLVQAANPVMTLADPARTLDALRALDLLVVMDYYLTPTAALADYVLPAAATVERDDLALRGPLVVPLPRGLDPLYERRDDYQLWKGLGRRLGQSDEWPWDTMEQVLDHRLAPAGLTFEALCEQGALFEPTAPGRSRELGFATPSGKVELRSGVLAALGCPDLPSHRALPEPEADYPLLLITGSAFNPMYHSEQRQWPTARRLRPHPEVTLHPSTAEALGVGTGDAVRIETPQGAVRQRVRIRDTVHPRMVDAQHGWWFPEAEAGADPPFDCLSANINALVRDDPTWCAGGTGAWQQTGLPCRIVPE
jgi:anaerobic selenocysteine-containing dehydrogenase